MGVIILVLIYTRFCLDETQAICDCQRIVITIKFRIAKFDRPLFSFFTISVISNKVWNRIRDPLPGSRTCDYSPNEVITLSCFWLQCNELACTVLALNSFLNAQQTGWISTYQSNLGKPSRYQIQVLSKYNLALIRSQFMFTITFQFQTSVRLQHLRQSQYFSIRTTSAATKS